jgi:hypothetical protein
VLFLVGCLFAPDVYEERLQELTDADRDGFRAVAEGGNDCDDHDADVYPGAPEVPYDGIDQDCSGADLDDVDGDGVPYPEDCDDDDAAVHPGARDACYDGVDADCAGNDDFDCDGDGFRVASSEGGTDCDDSNPATHPGAEDTCYDGLDADCAGDDDFDCDHDGYTEADCDCDDGDSARNPAATEGWGDLGTDNDCDGALDDDVTASLADANVVIDPPPATAISAARSAPSATSTAMTATSSTSPRPTPRSTRRTRVRCSWWGALTSSATCNSPPKPTSSSARARTAFSRPRGRVGSRIGAGPSCA